MKALLTIIAIASVALSLNAQNCYTPMQTRDFTMEYARLSQTGGGLDQSIRKFTADNCLSASQVSQLSGLYAYEQERYNYALYAYPLVVDPQNFGTVADAMYNQFSRQRLLDYIAANPLTPFAPPVPVYVPTPQPEPVPNYWYEPVPVQPPVVVYVPGYTGRVGCSVPMTSSEFSMALNSINSSSFENTKLQVALQIASNRCFTTEQVSAVMRVFSFESNKFEFAKAAFLRTYDIDNYHTVSQGFGFSSSTSALMDYISANMPPNLPYAAQLQPVQPSYPNTHPGHHDRHKPRRHSPVVVPPAPPAPPVYVPNYTGRIGCNGLIPMSQQEFERILQSINRNSMDNNKLAFAKQVIRGRCITSAQAREISRGFSFDNNRLDFAKNAYASVYDLDNYFQVADVFQFESNKRALMQFIGR